MIVVTVVVTVVTVVIVRVSEVDMDVCTTQVDCDDACDDASFSVAD